MKTTRMSILIVLLALLRVPDAMSYESCTPDYDAMGWLEPQTSMDQVVMDSWCAVPNAQDHINHYWNSLNLGHMGDYWYYLGTENGALICNPNTYLVRVMNAANMMQTIHWDLNNITLNTAGDSYDWLGFVASHSEYSYVATCETENVASNPVADGPPTKLHYWFFWLYDVAQRTGTLVHECVHDWSSHEGEGGDCDCGTSCDVSYPNSNATTFQIHFWNHAISAYKRDLQTDELMVMNYGNDICGYIPRLSQASRWRSADSTRWKLDDCFQIGGEFGPSTSHYWATTDSFWDYGGFTYNADIVFGARWPCEKICDPDDFRIGGNEFCNEEYQPGNEVVNDNNLVFCMEANAEVAGGVTPSERAALWSTFQIQKEECIPGISQEYLDAYCSDLMSVASTADDIADAWDLPDDPGYFDSARAMQACVRGYCWEMFDPAWVQPARDACYEWSDSDQGCMSIVCGSLGSLAGDYGEESLEYFQSVQCRRHFIEGSGNPSAYFAEEETDKCTQWYLKCRNDEAFDAWLEQRQQGECGFVYVDPLTGQYILSQEALQFPGAFIDITDMTYTEFTLSYPDTAIDKCMKLARLCEAITEMMAELAGKLVAVSEKPWAIAELEDLPRPMSVDRTAILIDDNMRSLADRVASGGPEAAMAARSLGKNPEMMHAVTRCIEQSTFFAAFGTRGLGPVFGQEALERFSGAQIEISPDETAERRAALEAIRALVPVRERVESPQTEALAEQAASRLTQAELFDFLLMFANAQTGEQLDAALDALQTAVE